MAGGSFELVCTPSDFYYSINESRQYPGGQSGNPADDWSAAICAAVVGEGKESSTVYDSNPTVNINNGIHGGALMSATKTNAVLEVIT